MGPPRAEPRDAQPGRKQIRVPVRARSRCRALRPPSSPRSPPEAAGSDRIQSPGLQGNTKNVSRAAFNCACL